MSKNLSPALLNWQNRGQFIPVLDQNVFVIAERELDAPALLILHGFPTFSFDFHACLEMLAQNYRVVIHDHPGFGLSDKPRSYSYSLIEQAEVALAVWQELDIQEAHLLAHDYGTSIATELLARQQRGGLPVKLLSLSLCNGSVHIELARLTIAQRLMRNRALGPSFVRLVSKSFFERRLRAIFATPDSVSREDLDVLWEGLNLNDGRHRLPQISRYLDERYRYWHRWIGALGQSTLPAHILWGQRDPIAVPEIAHRLHEEMPNSRLTFLPELGHYPMLESPHEWASSVLSFLQR
ncbi:MAG: alpha/beta fold hydrolase [bacterium]